MKDYRKYTEKYLIKSSIIVNNFQSFLLNKFIFRFYSPIKPNYVTNKLKESIFYINGEISEIK